MTEPRDDYVGEGGDGTDPELPETLPDPEPNTGPEDAPDGDDGPDDTEEQE